MAAELGAFLEHAASVGLVYGENDCMMIPADWVKELSGADPAAEWRGTYDDQDGAARIVAGAGGMVPLMRRGALTAGCYEVSPSVAGPGSVGVVMAPMGETVAETGAIRTETGWAVMTDEGLAVAPFYALAAWTVI